MFKQIYYKSAFIIVNKPASPFINQLLNQFISELILTLDT